MPLIRKEVLPPARKKQEAFISASVNEREETGSPNGRRKRAGEKLCTDQAAWSRRCRNRGSLARPYIERLTNLSLWTWASTGPLLYERVSAATTASLSFSRLCAKRRSSGI